MTVKVNGVTVNLGGTDYVIPPLSLGALEQLQDKIGGIQGDGNVNDVKQVSTVIDCAHAALKRNYPDMTREEVADLIDLSNMQDVFRAVMNVSGMVQAQGGEASGEVPAAG
ncbi:TPA: hypothetical protein ACFP4Q_000834 [Neisseria weaveri]